MDVWYFEQAEQSRDIFFRASKKQLDNLQELNVILYGKQIFKTTSIHEKSSEEYEMLKK